jgi:hypothetical protein
MTSPLTAQGPGTQAMHQTPFPVPFGLEQYPGQQQWGGQQFPGQLFGGQQLPGQQFQGGGQQQIVAQLLPIAYQAILPQVIATATQQVHQYVQYLANLQGGSRQWGF